ncbi:substrate-binding periplasmic protein [Chitinimonas koreensis]|uniref:substrate-binding periplasmic protein n=1 Tax=Chitinimonas koreensis TaxID=356302 RepID=UPI0003FD489D|nr:transporter substrate-binding domain-containing protein [Chitinimonas koreensis]QNM95381.1 transporter substrate-binding domain-containing protein [Chitinimonas koreensis]
MRPALAALLAWLAWLAAGSMAAAAADAARPDKLVFALRPLPPYMEVTPGGFGGAHVEILQRLADRLRVRLDIVECPLVRCLRMLQEGSADVTMGLAMTPERVASIVLLEPPYAAASPTYFYQRVGDRRPLRGYDDLVGRRIGVVRGVRYFDEFDGDARLDKQEAPDVETNFRKLAAGRLDVVPVGANVAAAIVGDPRFAGRVRPAEWVRPNPVMRRMALGLGSPWLERRAELDAALAAMVDAGETRAILDRYESAHAAACRKARRC